MLSDVYKRICNHTLLWYGPLLDHCCWRIRVETAMKQTLSNVRQRSHPHQNDKRAIQPGQHLPINAGGCMRRVLMARHYRDRRGVIAMGYRDSRISRDSDG